MNSVKNMLNNISNNDIILGIILLIYIFGGYKTPYEIAPYITNIMSYIIMVTIVGISLCNNNLIISILLGIAFLFLVNRSIDSHPKNVMPSQNYRDSVMNNLNLNNTFNSNSSNNLNININSPSKQQLEEFIVENIATVNYRSDDLDNNTYKPTMSNSNNAFEI